MMRLGKTRHQLALKGRSFWLVLRGLWQLLMKIMYGTLRLGYKERAPRKTVFLSSEQKGLDWKSVLQNMLNGYNFQITTE